jgi:hypothetical protein
MEFTKPAISTADIAMIAWLVSHVGWLCVDGIDVAT